MTNKKLMNESELNQVNAGIFLPCNASKNQLAKAGTTKALSSAGSSNVNTKAASAILDTAAAIVIGSAAGCAASCATANVMYM